VRLWDNAGDRRCSEDPSNPAAARQCRRLRPSSTRPPIGRCVATVGASQPAERRTLRRSRDRRNRHAEQYVADRREYAAPEFRRHARSSAEKSPGVSTPSSRARQASFTCCGSPMITMVAISFSPRLVQRSEVARRRLVEWAVHAANDRTRRL
jgi:hypothetical protein